MSNEKQPVTCLKVPLALKAFLLLAASYCCAIYLNAATNFWRVIESTPVPLRDAAVKILLFVSQPFQPAEAHAQEEFLELSLVWLFSAPFTILIFVVAYKVGLRVVARLAPLFGKNATAQ